MSSIPQTTADGNSVSDFATKFMKRFHLGKLLFQCNAGKEKGIPVMDVFRFLFCMMFSDRSFYMQMKTGTFGKDSPRTPSTVSLTTPGQTGSVSRHCFLPGSSTAS